MRAGKSLSVSSADIRRLEALVQDCNAPQKHVWWAEIVLLTSDGVASIKPLGAEAASSRRPARRGPFLQIRRQLSN
jgi:hypothetical protein